MRYGSPRSDFAALQAHGQLYESVRRFGKNEQERNRRQDITETHCSDLSGQQEPDLYRATVRDEMGEIERVGARSSPEQQWSKRCRDIASIEARHEDEHSADERSNTNVVWAPSWDGSQSSEKTANDCYTYNLIPHKGGPEGLVTLVLAPQREQDSEYQRISAQLCLHGRAHGGNLHQRRDDQTGDQCFARQQEQQRKQDVELFLKGQAPVDAERDAALRARASDFLYAESIVDVLHLQERSGGVFQVDGQRSEYPGRIELSRQDDPDGEPQPCGGKNAKRAPDPERQDLGFVQRTCNHETGYGQEKVNSGPEIQMRADGGEILPRPAKKNRRVRDQHHANRYCSKNFYVVYAFHKKGAPGLAHPCPFPATKPPIPDRGRKILARAHQ